MKLKIKEIFGSPGEPDRASGGQSPYFEIEPMNTMEEDNLTDVGSHSKNLGMVEGHCGCGCDECGVGAHHEEPYEYEIEGEEYPETIVNPEMISNLHDDENVIYIMVGDEYGLNEASSKKKGDRCIRIAKRKYNRWPSAYASGAVVKCRQGKIWRGLKETKSIAEFEILELDEEQTKIFLEAYKPNFSLEKSQGLHGWFKRNRGKGWIDCRTGKPCGREKAGRGAKRKYPACRPTKAQCNRAGTRRKRGKMAISWKPKKGK